MSESGSDGSTISSRDPRTGLRQTLKERHVNMIGFNGVLGVGLFLGAGKVVYFCGPGLAIIAYLLAGSVMWAVMGCIGEPTALFPVNGPNFEFVGRFLDQSLGISAAWFLWFVWVCIMMGEILVITNLFVFRVDPRYLIEVGYPEQNLQWWPEGGDPSSAIWIVLSLAIILSLNVLPAKLYGEIEYVIGCIKISFLVAVIMINIVLNAEKRFHDSRFWTYQLPWGFSSVNMTAKLGTDAEPPIVYTGSLGTFTALWTGLTTAFITMAGWDITFITAPENEDLTKAETVKLSGRKIGLRVIVLYVLGIFSVTLNVPYNDYPLGDLANYNLGQGQNSIFVLAAIREHVPVLPHVLNAFFIFSALAIASNSLFSSSRILYALAGIRDAWPWFLEDLRAKLETTRWGVPHRAVLTSWLFGFLSFMSLGTATSTTTLGRITAAWATALLIVYALNCLAYLNFYREINAIASGQTTGGLNLTAETRELYDRNSRRYPWKTRAQWARAVYGFVFCSLLMLFFGWRTLVPPFSAADFVATYISIPVFISLVAVYFLTTRGLRPSGWVVRAMGLTNLEPFGPVRVAAPKECWICHKKHRVDRVKWPPNGKGCTLERVNAVAEWIWIWFR